MPLFLRGSNNGFRIRLVNVLFEDVRVSISVRLEEDRPAVSRPFPNRIICFIQRQAPGILYGFSTWLQFCHIYVCLSSRSQQNQALRVSSNAELAGFHPVEGGQLSETLGLAQGSASCHIDFDLPK